jgi:hypothetical protein
LKLCGGRKRRGASGVLTSACQRQHACTLMHNRSAVVRLAPESSLAAFQLLCHLEMALQHRQAFLRERL